ncbi:MAG: hypothetical protein KAQ90_02390 [Melioribacteraceae bacterium]|nr:hypothetical protein [Melioribacteraceae bacterium]
MKKILFSLLMITSIAAAQSNQSKSLEELKIYFNQTPILNSDTLEIQYNAQKKKTGLAIIYSLLLPGMGELYAGNYSSGKYFTIADGVLWGTLIGVSAYANNQEENYRAFAETHGGVDLEGKDSKYFADIGNYLDIYQYNRRQELDRNFEEIYNLPEDYWNWHTQATRGEYRTMWKSSESANNSTRFIIGALILNRIASMINAIRLVNAHNNNLKKDLGWNVSFNYSNQLNIPDNFTMNFVTTF